MMAISRKMLSDLTSTTAIVMRPQLPIRLSQTVTAHEEDPDDEPKSSA